MTTPDVTDMPLPSGWVEEFTDAGHPYYVDTLVNPPRSIWIHPYEDEQYLQQHPEDRGRLQTWLAAQSRNPGAPQYPQPGESRDYYDGRAPDGRADITAMHREGAGERGLLGGGLLGEHREHHGLLGGLLGERERGMDRHALRREEHFERRMERRQERFDRRMERRYGPRVFVPPAYERPEYYPGQYGHGPQYAHPHYASPPPKEEHHSKILPFLGGVATGVVADELFHHFKDKKDA
ncbi:hypothetical protein BDP27DRAFT_1414670 [Rhodocollybia butyracea]|uniref:WW domain-containing protein n=1 Tax=Rhodocollybia butyracea TaxID=206335 RepID=A0A9P5UED9_9AGAR|nr:hypothetical protein BDP27DRAFT_1414670 [Rhodocollybia butyracea]